MAELTWSSDVSSADWIGLRLAPFGSGAGSVIPSGFEAYARILHPIDTPGGPVRWREVAAWSGLPMRPGVQFAEIAAPENRPAEPSPAQGMPPQEDTLGSDTARLVQILAAHEEASLMDSGEATPQPVWFCYWEGYGIWTAGSSAVLVFRRFSRTRHELARLVPPPLRRRRRMPRRYRALGVRPRLLRPSAWFRRPQPATWAAYPGPTPRPQTSGLIPQHVLDGPKVELPSRSYLLARGPLSGALTFVDSHGHSPNLWWPADRSWCVASELDLAWSYIGGSRALIDTILADPSLEAQPTSLDETLAERHPAWIDAAVDRAIHDALRHGRATVAPQWGGIEVTLRRPRLGGTGSLMVAAPDYSSTMTLSGQNLELSESVRHSLTRSVADILTQQE